MDPSHVPYRLAASYLQAKLLSLSQQAADYDPDDVDDGIIPQVGIICGSGLGGLSSTLEQPPLLQVDYKDIPGFPKAACTVSGHAGEVVIGYMKKKQANLNSGSTSNNKIPVICFRGRFHSYEGHDIRTTALPVLVMRCLRVPLVILTNAAGGLNADYNVGDVVCVSNHLALPCLVGRNPLVGPNDSDLGPRFPATSNAYHAHLRQVVVEAAQSLNDETLLHESGNVAPKPLKIHKSGTYCFVSGPMYESPAECAMLQKLGGDCVGMSTVPEVLAAHYSGMKVLCLSLITNKVVMPNETATSDNNSKSAEYAANHEEVLEAVQTRSKQLQTLVTRVVQSLASAAETSGNSQKVLIPLPAVSLKVPSTPLLTRENAWTLVKVSAFVALGYLLGQHQRSNRR